MKHAWRTACAVLVMLSAGAGPFEPVMVSSANCTVSMPELNFGAYSVFGSTAVDATGEVRYSCDGVVGGFLRLNLSAGGGGSFNPRLLDSLLGDYLAYNLYVNAARTAIWGDGTSGTTYYDTEGYASAGQVISVPVFLRVPAGQNVVASGYSDTVWATLIY